MKAFKRLFVLFLISSFCITSVLWVSASDTDYIIGTDHAEDSEYYKDFVGSLDEAIITSNILLEEHPMEDGTPRTVTADDVDFTKMVKCYMPTAVQLQQALENELTEIPTDWDSMWILPITVDGYTVRLFYKLGRGVEEGHLLTAEDGTPMLSEEELAAIASREGHYTIASASAAPTNSFETGVLSTSTVDTETVAQFYYVNVSMLRTRVAWVRTDDGNVFYPTTCDDGVPATASVFSGVAQADGMTQDEFRQMYSERYAELQAEIASYDGEDVYGAAGVTSEPTVSDTAGVISGVTVSDSVLFALIFAVAVTGAFVAVLLFRRRKTMYTQIEESLKK